ncbi:(2Fe-2S)-binding protein [Trichocoleus desertorum]
MSSISARKTYALLRSCCLSYFSPPGVNCTRL